jgi:hypothetical protein
VIKGLSLPSNLLVQRSKNYFNSFRFFFLGEYYFDGYGEKVQEGNSIAARAESNESIFF